MNEQLIKLIDLCLADGVISDKEREVIFRKAKALGIDEDECEIILEGMTQKAHNAPIVTNLTPAKPKRNFTLKEVKSIKPAPLDKEKELSKKVAVLKEKEKNLSSDFNLVLEDLQASNEKIKTIRHTLDFEYKALLKQHDININKQKTVIKKLITNIHNQLSVKYGKIDTLLTAAEMKRLTGYNLAKLKSTLNEKIISIIEEKYNSKQGCLLIILIIFVPLCILSFLMAASWSSSQNEEKWGVTSFISFVITVIAFVIIKNFTIKTKRIKEFITKVIDENTLTFNDTYQQMQESKKLINEYESQLKYNITVAKNLKNPNIEGIEIGNQIWMSENLNVDKFRNGDSIPHAETYEQWVEAEKKEQPAWCWPTDDKIGFWGVSSKKRKEYGKLYNHYAVADPRGLAPKGWKIPTEGELKELIIVDVDDKDNKILNPEIDLPMAGDDFLSDVGEHGFYWGSTVSGKLDLASHLQFDSSIAIINTNPRDLGFSVRCLKG